MGSVDTETEIKCPKCKKMINRDRAAKNKYVCYECGYYFRVKTHNRIRMVADRKSFQPWFEEIEESNPLKYEGYEEKLSEAREKSGVKEAVTVGECEIYGEKAVIGICESKFMMGSMGHVVGEKVTQAIEKATELRLPVFLFCCSGGARMQEGIVSLMQMAKTSAAIKRHGEAGLLYATILTDPHNYDTENLPHDGADYFETEIKADEENEERISDFVTVYGYQYTKGSLKSGAWRNGTSGGSSTSSAKLSLNYTQDTSYNISFKASVSGGYTNGGTIGSELGVTLGASKSYSLGSGYSVTVPKGSHYLIKYRPMYYTYKVVETKYKERYNEALGGMERYVVETKTCYVDVFSHWDFTHVAK